MVVLEFRKLLRWISLRHLQDWRSWRRPDRLDDFHGRPTFLFLRPGLQWFCRRDKGCSGTVVSDSARPRCCGLVEETQNIVFHLVWIQRAASFLAVLLYLPLLNWNAEENDYVSMLTYSAQWQSAYKTISQANDRTSVCESALLAQKYVSGKNHLLRQKKIENFSFFSIFLLTPPLPLM